MIGDVARAIQQAYCYIDSERATIFAKAAIIAALPHIKEAMEYHGVEGAMNKMIIKRLEDQCK